MSLQMIREDITRMNVDAIVNAANKTLLGGGGVDGAIHRAAGPELLEECRGLGGCKTGEAKLTGAYALPCRYVIHTVGPVWRGGLFGEKDKLAACYRHSLELAYQHGCRSVAFPLISAGAYGYPAQKAIKVAMDTISSFLLKCEEDLQVWLVVYNKEAVQIGSKLFKGIRQYIDDHYVESHPSRRQLMSRSEISWDTGAYAPVRPAMSEDGQSEAFADSDEGVYNAPYDADGDFCDTMQMEPVHACEPMPMVSAACSLEDALKQMDESFSQMVLRRIKEKGMKNAECYKKANLDKKLFSKIKKDIYYKPKKTTAVALAMALEMNLQETRELLMKAGFALSHSDKFDIIVEYFIKEKYYNVLEINEVLFYYDQPLLGCVVE